MFSPLIVSWLLYPDSTGGIELFNYHFASWLESDTESIPWLITAKGTATPKGIHTIKPNVMTSHFGSVMTFLGLLLASVRIRSKRKVFFFSYAKSSWKKWLGYYIISKLFSIPYIIYIHGGGMYPWKHHNIMRLVFRESYQVFCVSHLQKAEYERRISKSVIILPPSLPFSTSSRLDNGISPNSFTPSNSFVFLYVGSLKHIKGTDILVNAFSLLGSYATSNNIHLILVGGGDIEKYSSMVNPSVEPNVHFIGRVPNDQVCKYYSMADVFVLPSRAEGLPIALMEAMYNGLPTIIPALETFPLELKDDVNCCKFTPRNADILAAKMKYVHYSDGYRDSIGEAGHQQYLRSWSHLATYKKLYSTMLSAVASYPTAAKKDVF